MNIETRSTRLFWIFGVVLLVVSLAGTSYFIYPGGGRTQPPPPPAADEPVYCFGHVDADGGVISLYPAQPGRIVAVVAREGEEVKKGAPLLKLDDRLAKLRVAEAKSAVAGIRTQLELAKSLGKQHALKVEQQNAAIEVASQARTAVELELKYMEGLLKAQGTNKEKVEVVRAKLEQTKAAYGAEQAKMRELQSHEHDSQLAVTRAEAELDAMQARLDQAELAVRECELRAPCDGRVLRIQVNVGDTVVQQSIQPPVLFWPGGTLIIRAEVIQEFAGEIRPNLAVVITDDAEAHKTEWKGKIDSVSWWFARRRSMLLEPGVLNDVRTLECIIKLDDPDLSSKPPLRIGQRVRVRILLPRGKA